MGSRTFRDCADCHKRVLMEDGRTTCEGCLANRVTGELVSVDIALMMAGWNLHNTPAGAMAAKLPRTEPAVEGDTLGMSREDFIDKLAAAARRNQAPRVDMDRFAVPAESAKDQIIRFVGTLPTKPGRRADADVVVFLALPLMGMTVRPLREELDRHVAVDLAPKELDALEAFILSVVPNRNAILEPR